MPNTTKVKELSSNQRNAWFGGFTPQSEILNGRLAMIGFVAVIVIEVVSGHGFLHFWNIL
ncbi:chlorophyll a/b-binding protein [Calothrix sp. NIES-2098]|uniref:chlorophyll a/b-binding protein n=1 Tax=Calothrix sp. NIES-2098 TaxID=1954171 RepID=UPI000B61FE38|nr:CAB/ELIP/HLIP superfamily protein [Calothrix sp. NIES-2098]